MFSRWFTEAGTLLARVAASPRARALLGIAVMIAVLWIAFGALREILAGLRWSDVRADLARVSTVRIACSVAFTIGSYVVLTGYDVVSLRIIGRSVGYGTAALASFTSYIFSHNFGFAALTGGAARLRIYGRRGLSLGEVAQIMAMTGVTFWMGVMLLIGIGFVALPGTLALGGWHASYPHQAAVGGLILAGLATYLVVLHRRAGRALRVFGWTLVLPSVATAGVQFLLAAVDLMFATAALFVLVPDLPLSAFPLVLMAYLLAFLSGLLAHAPGGVGVFEAVLLLALPQVDRATLLAALLLFRVIYYLVPLAIGIVLFAAHELYARAGGPIAAGRDAHEAILLRRVRDGAA
ncbi:lysylphosphatidylglycerol synthase domain-containing protein [Sphingomonas sp.]|uniref:lysylphosphatidylglycerol synthase domain-containing protein n=1 Tax=Sphingomonas sp. TaxID=28214 RepID=UPI0035C7F8D4